MALNVQNKNFLSLLHKLGFDLNEFPDKTFDGLFDSVPENINFYFNWFLENITPANVLTKMEEATYFELENNDLLLSDEEMSHFLSMCEPRFEEVENLDIGFIKSCLPDTLKDLKKNHKHLVDVYQTLESNHNALKKMYREKIEQLNVRKKQLEAIKGDCEKTASLIKQRANDVESFLLNWTNERINSEIYEQSIKENEVVIHKLKNCNILEHEVSDIDNINTVPKLEDNLVNIETTYILSQGLLQSTEVEIDTLVQFLQEASTNLSFSSPRKLFISPEKSDPASITQRCEKIRALELELYNKIKYVSAVELEKIVNCYYLKKADTTQKRIDYLNEIKTFVKSNGMKNSWLQHILLAFVQSLEKIKESRKECLGKINQLEIMLYNNVTNFKLRKKMFEEVCQRQSEQVQSLKEALGPQNMHASLGNIMSLVHDFVSNDETSKVKADLELAISRWMNEVLCGPTSQIMHIPVELVRSFHKCHEKSEELSKKIKRLVNAYVETKDSVAKNDRTSLLMWIDFLTNPTKLESIASGHSTSSEN